MLLLGVWPWRVHRFRCYNADVHNHHSEIMLLSILTTTQHATIPLTTRIATLIWSLVISKVDYRRRLWSLSRGCHCHRTDVLCDVFWTHHPATPPPSLDASSRADTITPLCSDIPLSQRYSFILLCQHHLQLTLRDAAIFTRWHRQLWLFHTSDDQPWVTVHSVAALRPWNSLPLASKLHRHLPTRNEDTPSI